MQLERATEEIYEYLAQTSPNLELRKFSNIVILRKVSKIGSSFSFPLLGDDNSQQGFKNI